MEKYMGNKSKICQKIFEATRSVEPDISEITVFDPFSGTTNVSRYFKKQGANIVCNDINDLSYVLAKCYIECCRVPTFDGLFQNKIIASRIENAFTSHGINYATLLEQLILDNRNTTEPEFVQKYLDSNYFKILVYLTYIASESDWGEKYTPYYLIQKNYCENGGNAKYLNQVHKKTIANLKKRFEGHSDEQSLIDHFLEYPYSVSYLEQLSDVLLSKGLMTEKATVDSLLEKNLVGSRKFFSEEHGKRFDIILNLINYWWSNELISEMEYYILLTAVIESIAIFSNTSATYQAFYKDYRANTQQRFRLIIPVIDETQVSASIYQEDVCTLIPRVNADVLYLDPPYNWRQYDSNYHLLNTVAKFHRITDWADFERGIVGASGENREKKLNYTSFNVKKGFEELLISLIKSSPCRTVVLSYSDSKSNHERDAISTTLNTLSNFFENTELFEYYHLHTIGSVNFESRKGNKKNAINELLFVARKRV